MVRFKAFQVGILSWGDSLNVERKSRWMLKRVGHVGETERPNRTLLDTLICVQGRLAEKRYSIL